MIHEKIVNSPINSRIIKWAAVLCYASLIFYMSSLSASPHALAPFFMFDKVLHFFEYGIFGFLLYFALAGERWEGKPLLPAFMIGSIYGISDEFHQYFVPTRECDVFDFLADAAGSGSGAFFASFMSRGRAH